MPRTTQEAEVKMYDRRAKKKLLKEARESLVKYLQKRVP